jgi:hypothetical protein
MKKSLNMAGAGSVLTRAGKSLGEYFREVKQGLRDGYESPLVRGLGLTAMSQVVSAKLVSYLYNGNQKETLSTDAVFTAPVAFFTGRGLRKAMDLMRVPETRARTVLLWTNPVIGVAGAKAGAALIANSEHVAVTEPTDVLDYVGANVAGSVENLPTDYFDEASVLAPGAIAGTVAAANGMQASPKRPR